MKRIRSALARKLFVSLAFLVAALAAGTASAGDWPWRVRRTVAVRRVEPRTVQRVTGTLGTFYPTPYITVRGNDPVGGGYSPLGIYGDQTMSLYGPLSPLRMSTAPVRGYVRGYDGQTR